MYDASFIQTLKQVNVSKDAEKTMQRVRELWMPASKTDRQTIEQLADVSTATVQRVYKTGSLSAKLVVPMSQTLNVSPKYLTGESDERGVCSEEQLAEFLTAHGYSAPTRKMRKPRVGMPVKEATAEDTLYTSVSEANQANVAAPMPTINTDADNMTEDEMILLMRAILLRARAGGKNAELARKLKALLLS